MKKRKLQLFKEYYADYRRRYSSDEITDDKIRISQSDRTSERDCHDVNSR